MGAIFKAKSQKSLEPWTVALTKVKRTECILGFGTSMA